MHAYQYYSIGIDNKKALANGDGFQCSSSSASSDNHDDELSNESLLKKLCVLLCMPQNVSECSSEHLKLLKFPGGACPQTPPTMNSCRVPMFSTSANDIAPPHGKSYVQPSYSVKMLTVSCNNIKCNSWQSHHCGDFLCRDSLWLTPMP